MRDKVVYIGNFSPSVMDAQTQLVVGNCKILRELGLKITLICNDNVAIERGEDFHYALVEGFDCFSLRFNKSIKDALNSKRLYEQVTKILEDLGSDSIAYVFLYGSIGFAVQVLWLSRWCKRHEIKIVANVVDIPDLRHGCAIERIVKAVDRKLQNHCISSEMDGQIAVSAYIRQYFLKKTNYPILVLPPLKDTEVLRGLVFAPREKIKKIVYVGVPFPIDGRKVDESAYKDRVDLFIDLLCSSSCRDWKLDIYGVTMEQYSRVITRQIALLRKFQNQIIFHGRINHSDALHVVADADYSVVYRLKNRMTMAGFSTKFVESISCGTPVLMTDTSEYIKYAEKGVPCFLFDLDDEKQRRDVLENALRKSSEEMMVMKEKCRESHAFDYREYVQSMRDFLTQVDDRAN